MTILNLHFPIFHQRRSDTLSSCPEIVKFKFHFMTTISFYVCFVGICSYVVCMFVHVTFCYMLCKNVLKFNFKSTICSLWRRYFLHNIQSASCLFAFNFFPVCLLSSFALLPTYKYLTQFSSFRFFHEFVCVCVSFSKCCFFHWNLRLSGGQIILTLFVRRKLCSKQ
jgi:hypothetical protein